MNEAKFVLAVRQMRALQTEFFALQAGGLSRQTTLVACKRAEKRVDDMIAESDKSGDLGGLFEALPSICPSCSGDLLHDDERKALYCPVCVGGRA